MRLTRELQVLPGGKHVTPERPAFLELITHKVLSDDESEWGLPINNYEAIEKCGQRNDRGPAAPCGVTRMRQACGWRREISMHRVRECSRLARRSRM